MSSGSYPGSTSQGDRCVPLASSLEASIKIDGVLSGLTEAMPQT
jgi:hypothetical protein